MLGLADDGMAVGRLGAEEERNDGLLLQIPRLVFVAAELGDDGPFFLFEFVLRIDPEILHPVGLDGQRQLPPVGRKVEVKDREVFGRVGVVLAAVGERDVVDLARHDLVGSLEHQMFEIVRQASVVQLFVSRADAVGHHRGDDGRARDRIEIDVQSVGQHLGADVVVERVRCFDRDREFAIFRRGRAFVGGGSRGKEIGRWQARKQGGRQQGEAPKSIAPQIPFSFR